MLNFYKFFRTVEKHNNEKMLCCKNSFIDSKKEVINFLINEFKKYIG